MASARTGRQNTTQSVVAYNPSEFKVQLVFDTWTPRPHFIVVQRQQKADATNTELQETYELIGRFLLEYPQFNPQATLSFHRGQWYQKNTGHWHAHLSVLREPYEALATTQIIEPGNNKEWAGTRTYIEASTKWHENKARSYTIYKEQCLKNAVKIRSRVDQLLLSKFDSNQFSLVWTSPAPRIGVVAKSSAGTSTLASLYDFMTDFRHAAEDQLKKLDSIFTNFGCHLCLFVRGQEDTKLTEVQCQVLTLNGMQQSNIVGYIHMDETNYVEWLPVALRQTWLDEFRKVPHFVRT